MINDADRERALEDYERQLLRHASDKLSSEELVCLLQMIASKQRIAKFDHYVFMMGGAAVVTVIIGDVSFGWFLASVSLLAFFLSARAEIRVEDRAKALGSHVAYLLKKIMP